jgi:arylsulfatase A
VVHELGSTLDLLPTFCSLAGIDPPPSQILDGYDLSAALRGQGPSPRQEMFFYRGQELFAARLGAYKVHYKTQPGYGGEGPVAHDPPLLYDLELDPGERFDVAAQHPDVLERIKRRVAAHRATVVPVPDQLAIRLPR